MNKKRVLAIIAIVAIVVIMMACLCACNAESIAKKLEKKGYEVKTLTSTELKTINAAREGKGYKGIIGWAVLAAKGDEAAMVYKYEKAADAREDYKAIKEEGYAEIKLVGSVIFFGTEQGVKDAM